MEHAWNCGKDSSDTITHFLLASDQEEWSCMDFLLVSIWGDGVTLRVAWCVHYKGIKRTIRRVEVRGRGESSKVEMKKVGNWRRVGDIALARSNFFLPSRRRLDFLHNVFTIILFFSSSSVSTLYSLLNQNQPWQKCVALSSVWGRVGGNSSSVNTAGRKWGKKRFNKSKKNGNPYLRKKLNFAHLHTFDSAYLTSLLICRLEFVMFCVVLL